MDLFVKRILEEALIINKYHIDVNNFDSYPYLGDGAEGTVRKYDKYAVKKYDNVSLTSNSAVVKHIVSLIQSPDPDVIRYYDIFEQDEVFYSVMQLLSKSEMNGGFSAMNDFMNMNSGDEYYEILDEFISNSSNQILLNKLKPVIKVPIVDFTVRMINKGYLDVRSENIGMVNNKFILVDWSK